MSTRDTLEQAIAGIYGVDYAADPDAARADVARLADALDARIASVAHAARRASEPAHRSPEWCSGYAAACEDLAVWLRASAAVAPTTEARDAFLSAVSRLAEQSTD